MRSMSADDVTMIEKYIPHRGPMRLVDRLIEADDEQALVEADVPAQGRFVRDGSMPAWVGIELMAQSISAWAGARALRRGRPPQLGLLLGSRKFEMRRASVPAGATLRIRVRCELLAGNGLGMFECRMTHGDEELASAFVSVFEPGDAMSFLAGGPP
jgi:predicted hotdog family 3-hydroxylacyl-ACP dehydratase